MTTTNEYNFFDDEFLRVAAHLSRFGFLVQSVGAGECAVPGCTCGPSAFPYAYSVGLHRLGHPEMVVFGAKPDHAHDLGHVVFDPAAAGTPLAIGREHRHEVGDRLWVVLDPVPDQWFKHDPSRIAIWWQQFGRDQNPSFVQVCYSDSQGRMPWERDCDIAARIFQPVLSQDPISYPPRRRASTKRRRR